MLNKLLVLAVLFSATLALAPDAGAQTSSETAPPAPVLSHAYPNPFSAATTFELTLDESQEVRVEVFNVLGQRVRTLHDGRLSADDVHRFSFEGDNLTPGIYLYRVTGDDFSLTRRVMRVP